MMELYSEEQPIPFIAPDIETFCGPLSAFITSINRPRTERRARNIHFKRVLRAL